MRSGKIEYDSLIKRRGKKEKKKGHTKRYLFDY